MNKKGIALAVVLVVTAVLSVIIISLFAQAMHERNLVRRHVNTVRAFWLAEAGVSEALIALDNISLTEEERGCPSGAVCSYRATVQEVGEYVISIPVVDSGLAIEEEEVLDLMEMIYVFNDSTLPPLDEGELSLNNSNSEHADEIYVSTKDKNKVDVSDNLSEVDDDYYVIIYRTDGGVIDGEIEDDGIGKAVYEVDSVVPGADYFIYEVSNLSVQGSFVDDRDVKITFVPKDLVDDLEDLTNPMEVDYEYEHYEYHQIVSTGKVVLPGGGEIEEEITAFVSLHVDMPPFANFPYAIESTGDIIIQGQAYTIEPEGSKKTYSELNFSQLFGATKAEIKNSADYLYDETDNFTGDGVEVTGLTWVEVSEGEQLTIAGNFEGEGVLIVNGDCRITGTESFEGVIYVIGELQISGTASVTGSILAESGLDIDTTISGNVSLTHDQDVIRNALGSIRHLGDRAIISWQKK